MKQTYQRKSLYPRISADPEPAQNPHNDARTNMDWLNSTQEASFYSSGKDFDLMREYNLSDEREGILSEVRRRIHDRARQHPPRHQRHYLDAGKDDGGDVIMEASEPGEDSWKCCPNVPRNTPDASITTFISKVPYDVWQDTAMGLSPTSKHRQEIPAETKGSDSLGQAYTFVGYPPESPWAGTPAADDVLMEDSGQAGEIQEDDAWIMI